MKILLFYCKIIFNGWVTTIPHTGYSDCFPTSVSVLYKKIMLHKRTVLGSSRLFPAKDRVPALLGHSLCKFFKTFDNEAE